MSPSEAAFRFSVQRLFDKHPKLYFWTVTFPVLHSDWVCSKRWSAFLKHLQNLVGKGWGGLRVTELHRDHGVHFHFLCTERLAVDLVRRVGRCHGIGRIQVCRADSETGGYMAKYLSKRDGGAKTESGRGARRWAAFGDIEHTRVRDVEVITPQWSFRRNRGLSRLAYAIEVPLSRVWWCSEPEQFAEVWRLCKQAGNAYAALDVLSGGRRFSEARDGSVFLVQRAEFVVQPF